MSQKITSFKVSKTYDVTNKVPQAPMTPDHTDENRHQKRMQLSPHRYKNINKQSVLNTERNKTTVYEANLRWVRWSYNFPRIFFPNFEKNARNLYFFSRYHPTHDFLSFLTVFHRNKLHTDIITFDQTRETMSITLREEHKLRAAEDKVLRRIFGRNT
jgi:hypothetical protein